jgi:hypothetical protein
MSVKLENVPDSMQPPSPLDTLRVEHFEGIGDLTIGVGSNWHIIAVALCLLNDPKINKFFLFQKLRLNDRITKTRIFPRDGMALPNGEVYTEPQTEVEDLELPEHGE